MIHLGDITRIHGAGAPIVEVIIGGSPCQDLSVAGKRAGLAGERSGLFMDQVRVVKEMRDYDARINARTGVDVRPRYMVWENVPGAFSSNGGDDFRAVLEEIARVVEKDAVIPEPPNGKWQTAGCIVGDGWSIAWRVLDAQFWGVPQRRRRIALVADFGGDTAPEILFEREIVSGDSQKGGAQGKGTAGDVGGGSEGAIGVDLYNQTQTGEVSKTLNAAATDADHVPCVVKPRQGEKARSLGCEMEKAPSLETSQNAAICIRGNCIDRADTAGCNGKGWRDDDVSFTLNTIDRPAVYDARGNGDGTTAPTLTGDHQNRVTDYTAVCIGNGRADQLKTSNKVGALNCMHDQQAVMVAKTLRSNGADPHREDCATYPITNNVVRRLTPLECERLQGYPDGWTDIGEWIDSKGKNRTITK